MKITGAIFDMDGLLIDSERVYQETWNELAKERGIKLPDDFIPNLCGSSGEHLRRLVCHYYKTEEPDPIIMACRKGVREKLAIHTPVKKGVKELLTFMKEKGYRLAVASSSFPDQIEANLNNAGLIGFFDEVVSGTLVEHGKPAPDVFLYAAERIGCDPKECYVFEDSANGVKAGAAAGCITCMIPDLLPPNEELKKITYGIYQDLLEFKKLEYGA